MTNDMQTFDYSVVESKDKILSAMFRIITNINAVTMTVALILTVHTKWTLSIYFLKENCNEHQINFVMINCALNKRMINNNNNISGCVHGQSKWKRNTVKRMYALIIREVWIDCIIHPTTLWMIAVIGLSIKIIQVRNSSVAWDLDCKSGARASIFCHRFFCHTFLHLYSNFKAFVFIATSHLQRLCIWWTYIFRCIIVIEYIPTLGYANWTQAEAVKCQQNRRRHCCCCCHHRHDQRRRNKCAYIK